MPLLVLENLGGLYRFEAVQAIHRSGKFAAGSVRQYANDFVDQGVEFFGFPFAQAAENIACDLAAVAGVADADAQALEVVGAEVSNGVPQAVVSTMAAAFF
jgi:hypothetical protein